MGSAGKAEKLARGYDGGQWDVPRIGRKLPALLEAVGKSDQEWFGWPMALPKKGEALVVIAAPHAEAVALPVKGNQGKQHNVQGFGVDVRALGRFRNAKAVLFQPPSATAEAKPQFSAPDDFG